MNTKSIKIKSYLNYIGSVISWTVFVILLSCAFLLAYYFVSLKLYDAKGSKYRPIFSIYTIVSPSMVPTINVRDIIVNKTINDPKVINIGDIITFKSTGVLSNGLTVTHRVQDININESTQEYEYTTKGDNNLIKDDSPATYSNLVGKVILRFPGLGNLQAFVASKFGWLIVVIVPALYILIADVFKLIRVTRMKNKASIANKKVVEETVANDMRRLNESN